MKSNKTLSAASTSLNSNKPLPTKIYYGWFIVFMASLSMFFSGPGQTYTISVFIDSYINSFGWSRSLVSGVYSAATLFSGLLLFWIGKGVDRYGPRIMSLLVASMLAVACLWSSFISGPIMLFVGFFLIRYFGQGSMTLVPNTLIPQWFVKQRGLAFSLMGIGGFVGATSFPPLTLWLINNWGWPVAWRILACALLIIFVPLAFLFMRNRPEDIGELPDSPKGRLPNTEREDKHSSKPAQKTASMESVVESSWTLQEARNTKAFWLILYCVAVPAMVNTGIVFHIFSIFQQHHVPDSTISLVLSLMFMLSFPTTFLAGYILDRFKINLILALMFIGQLLVMILLLFATSPSLAILFAVIRGLVGGFEGITLSVIWPNYFGREHIGSIKGIAMSSMVIGSAFGPLPFGIAYDWFGGYTEIILIMMLFPLLAAIAAFIARKPVK